MDVDPDVSARRERGLAGVDSHLHGDLERPLRLFGRSHCVGSVLEDDEEGVSLRIDLKAPVP